LRRKRNRPAGFAGLFNKPNLNLLGADQPFAFSARVNESQGGKRRQCQPDG
jgi:hypothetical protein